jgi:hypothetical protein
VPAAYLHASGQSAAHTVACDKPRGQATVPAGCAARTQLQLQPFSAVSPTGFPCAPILGCGSSTRTPLGVSAAMLRVTSATSRHTWWMPPAEQGAADHKRHA